jgi:TIGR03009 family protein
MGTTKLVIAVGLVLAAGLVGGWTWGVAGRMPGAEPAAADGGTALPARQPPGPAEVAPEPNPVEASRPDLEALDRHLRTCERALNALRSLTVQFRRTTRDKAFEQTTVFAGTARYLAPAMFVLEMRRADRPELAEKFVSTGTHLYEFVPRDRVVRVHELPPATGAQSPALSFFGLKADEARRRYHLKLVKEDQWYVYIEALPRLAADRAEFQQARLVLTKGNGLPRQLWYRHGEQETQWDFVRVEMNAPLERAEFTAPVVPPGWKMVDVAGPTRRPRD